MLDGLAVTLVMTNWISMQTWQADRYRPIDMYREYVILKSWLDNRIKFLN